VIARVDFEGVPQKLASSVTDSSRLDVAPRLELIDAVDVDGDGPAAGSPAHQHLCGEDAIRFADGLGTKAPADAEILIIAAVRGG
jgi:hypothetical protein